LAFDEKSLEVQRKVVSEEFKEHYINKPYGDVWFKLREMVFKSHTYRWMTIGNELSHIEQASLEDVKSFFKKHYSPSNAILVIAGKVKTDAAIKLAEKYFGDIPPGTKYQRHIPAEGVQNEERVLEVNADVPLDALYKVWKMPARLNDGYYVGDMVTEVLGGGASSRLYQKLVKEERLFSSIDCYHFGSVEEGMLTIEGKLVKGVEVKKAEKAVNSIIEEMVHKGITEHELSTIKNKTEAVLALEDMNILTRANTIAFYELLGDEGLFNKERVKYFEVTRDQIAEFCNVTF